MGEESAHLGASRLGGAGALSRQISNCSQDLFMLLKVIEEPKELLSINI